MLHDARLDRGFELVGRAGLGEEAEDLRFVHRRCSSVAAWLSGEKNAGSVGVVAHHLVQQRRAVHGGHAHIRDDNRRAPYLLQHFQRFGAAECGMNLVILAKMQDEALDDAGLIVHAHDAREILIAHAGTSSDSALSATRRTASFQSNGALTDAR